METTMFTLGVLSMILAALVALVIYGIVTVLKLNRELYNAREDRSNIWRQLHENNRDVYLHYDRKLEDTQRDFGDVYNTIAAVGGKIEGSVEHLQSYVDRRFDKLIDTYLLVKDTEKESKKIING